MEHELAAAGLTTVATVALVVLIAGLTFGRIKQPPLVAYILAGLILGPVTGFIAPSATIRTLAEFGVLMLLFIIGVKLDLQGFRAVWRIATAVTLAEIFAATAIAWIFGHFLDWSTGLVLFFGFALALSSTAVVSQIIPTLPESCLRAGNITLAILIAQDLALAPMIQILSTFAAAESGSGALTLSVLRTVFAVALLALAVWWLSQGEPRNRLRRFFIQLRHNEQLAPTAGLFLCFGAAAISGWLGLSAAYGAFLAGLLCGNSAGRELILRQMEPVQAILVMVFFFSIGLLLSPVFILDNLVPVLAALAFVMVVKTLINFLVLRRLGEDHECALTSSALLSNIGEFSFLLASVGISLGLAHGEQASLVISVAVLSLLVSPLYLLVAQNSHSLALLEVPIHNFFASRFKRSQTADTDSSDNDSSGNEFSDNDSSDTEFSDNDSANPDPFSSSESHSNESHSRHSHSRDSSPSTSDPHEMSRASAEDKNQTE